MYGAYIVSHQRWYSRRRAGRGFRYFDDDERVTDQSLLEYFASLGIPPAWRDVQIAHNKRARILAIGSDGAGRRQYIYHPSFRAKQEQAKFERIVRFARALPRMREVTETHLAHKKLDREKVLACIVRLMDEAYFRVGNDVYAREHQSYGITTLRSKHTTVEGATIVFDFIGKSGQHQVKRITNRRLARIVKQLDELPGYEVFKYYDEDGHLTSTSSADVNAYIKDIMGEEFTAKDFRTWGGTLIAASELLQIEPASSDRERKKQVTARVKRVASRLGNTPAIARSSYIDPRVINSYMDGSDLRTLRTTMEKMEEDEFLTRDERCVLQLLERKNT